MPAYGPSGATTMSLLDPDGYVTLSPSKLDLLTCPRRGRWYLERPDGYVNTPALVGRAAHAVLANLASQHWPDDAFGVIPNLAAHALHREGLERQVSPADYARELAGLVQSVRSFVAVWSLPSSSRALVEAHCRLTDRLGGLRLYGRLDVLLPPDKVTDFPSVLDWKAGFRPLVDELEPPLSVIGQAMLARARLGLRTGVVVRRVYIREAAEQVWNLDHEALVDGWRRVRGIASYARGDRWPPRPGLLCERCPETGCQHNIGMPDVSDLGIPDPEDDGTEEA